MFASGKTAAVASAANYIEDVFSTYLYTGNGSTQVINNGIDLSTKGGLVWTKNRQNYPNYLIDTVQTKNKILVSNSTAAAITAYDSSYYGLTSFNTNGYTLGPDFTESLNTGSTRTFVSWTFRKQPKFFDVVTWTGNGANRTISHALGSVPACIIVKRTDTTGDWQVYHRSLANTEYLVLNTTAAKATGATRWNSTTPTSTVFSLGTDATVNASGGTYVAYIFAHDAGGFGLTGTDNVISCGSFTTDGSGNATVNLGYEPQWVLVKNRDVASNWYIADTMRGFTANSFLGISRLYPNLSSAEDGASDIYLTSTGFAAAQGSGPNTYIYIAIRRGPMKVPTSGTSVFSPNAINNATGTANTTGFPIDLQILDYRSGTAIATFSDRLRGVATTTTATSAPYLFSSSTAAEASSTSFTNNWGNTGFATPSDLNNFSGILWNFRRAPSFFDEVCFNGSSTNFTVNHNLQAIPELIILKKRSGTGSWFVGGTIVGFNSANNNNTLFLNNVNAIATSTLYTSTWTSSAMYMSGGVNFVAGTTGVAYLFATCAGVSKVGSYTGTGTTKQIDCGFTGGARFVLIKRTDSTGDWYVWDSARGIVAGNDPYLLLNSTAAEVTSTDYIDTYSAGFEISSTAPAAINASGGTFIFLAIA